MGEHIYCKEYSCLDMNDKFRVMVLRNHADLFKYKNDGEMLETMLTIRKTFELFDMFAQAM